MSRGYRAVLFDFFGTLTCAVSRGPAHEDIARRLGCTPEAYARALDETFFARAIGAYGPPAAALRVVAVRAGGHPTAHTLHRLVGARIDAIRADTVLRPDAVGVLAALRARGLRTGVISDCGPEFPILLPEMPVAPLLDTVILSIEFGCHKPDAAMYRAACNRLRVTPTDTLYIGDGGSQELTGATAAGLTAIKLDADDLHAHLAFRPEHAWPGLRIQSLTDILALLDTVRRTAALMPPARRPPLQVVA